MHRALAVTATVAAFCAAPPGFSESVKKFEARVAAIQCSPSQLTPYLEEGTSRFEGQAFLKTRGGEVRYGAGSEVIAVPATSCAREWWEAISGIQRDEVEIFPPNLDFLKATRRTIADGEGRFRFDGLAPGEYFVRTSVKWEIPGKYGASTQGGYVGGLYGAVADKTTTVMLVNQLERSPK